MAGDEGGPGSACLFVGVGIDHYDHFDELASLDDIDCIAGILAATQGFATTVLKDVSSSGARRS